MKHITEEVLEEMKTKATKEAIENWRKQMVKRKLG